MSLLRNDVGFPELRIAYREDIARFMTCPIATQLKPELFVDLDFLVDDFDQEVFDFLEFAIFTTRIDVSMSAQGACARAIAKSTRIPKESASRFALDIVRYLADGRPYNTTHDVLLSIIDKQAFVTSINDAREICKILLPQVRKWISDFPAIYMGEKGRMKGLDASLSAEYNEARKLGVGLMVLAYAMPKRSFSVLWQDVLKLYNMSLFEVCCLCLMRRNLLVTEDRLLSLADVGIAIESSESSYDFQAISTIVGEAFKKDKGLLQRLAERATREVFDHVGDSSRDVARAAFILRHSETHFTGSPK